MDYFTVLSLHHSVFPFGCLFSAPFFCSSLCLPFLTRGGVLRSFASCSGNHCSVEDSPPPVSLHRRPWFPSSLPQRVAWTARRGGAGYYALTVVCTSCWLLPLGVDIRVLFVDTIRCGNCCAQMCRLGEVSLAAIHRASKWQRSGSARSRRPPPPCPPRVRVHS